MKKIIIIMDERKYEDALKRAKELLDDMDKGDYFASKADIENIFPEIKEKENEDEKIRKAIIAYISHDQHCGVSNVDMLAWLENQGEKVTNINGEDYGIDGLYHAIKILEKTVGKVTGYQSDDGILEHKAAINAVKELYEKQGEKKPTDKTEPKTLDADKVIGWLYENVADFWANPCNPQNVINQFKKDFGLC